MTLRRKDNGSSKNAAAATPHKTAGRVLPAVKEVKSASLQVDRKVVRRKSGEDRRNEILETVRDLIFNEGFSNFTVREGAGRVGISEAAIYRHFSSKEEMLLALLDALFTPWRDALCQLVEDDLPFARKLEELSQLHLHHLLNERLNPILFLSEAVNPQNQRLLATMRLNLGYLRDAVKSLVVAGLKSRQIRQTVSVESLVAAILGLLQNSVIRWTLQRSSENLLEDGARNMAALAATVTTQEVNR
jgi:AcrR family transcriptional regulator